MFSYNKKFSYKAPTSSDPRDYVFGESNINYSKLSENSSLSKYVLKVTRVENQGEYGLCVNFALTTSFEHLIYLLTSDSFEFSN